MFLGIFQKSKPKETKVKVSQREKKEIIDKHIKDSQNEKRKVLSTEINKDKQSTAIKPEKEHFSEIEVISFQSDELKVYHHRVEHFKGHNDQIIFDEQFLLNDEDDPDKIYQELKKKQQRRMQMDDEEKKLSENIKKANKEISEENEAFKKIRDYLKRSPAADRLDFTQNLLKMAQELGKQLTINGILPSMKILATDNENIKIALAEQVNAIASFLIDKNTSSDEYHHCLSVMVPILNEFLYDKSDKVKKKAVKALVEFWDLLTPNDRGDYILKFMLELAHEEDDEKARITALQILNKVAGKLDSELWEKFVVKEIKSLAIDPFELVRKNVAANLNNVCKMVNRDWFLQEIFPLLSNLGNDKDADVRNSWVEQVSRISSVWPATIRTGQLETLYLNFMQDKNKKVKINAFKYLGRFLETLQNLQINDEFLDQFTETGLHSKNKELLFYCAYNIPGILYILKGDSWSSLEELYTKLSKSNDVRVRKTLAHSIHEIAKIIGREKSEELLIDFLKSYLKDNLKEIRTGVIKHLHEFCKVISEEQRSQFLKIYKAAEDDKTMIDVYAENIGDFAKLFSPKEVSDTLLPLFYSLSQSRLANVRKAASQNLSKILDVYIEDKKTQENIIHYVQRQFWRSTTYTSRQAYIYMAASVMNSNKELFEEHMKATFCHLARDRVSNVRLVLAHALNNHIKSEGNFYFDFEINKALFLLKKDKDRDVHDILSEVTLVISEEEIEEKLKAEMDKIIKEESKNENDLEKSQGEQSGDQSDSDKLDCSEDYKDNSEQIEDVTNVTDEIKKILEDEKVEHKEDLQPAIIADEDPKIDEPKVVKEEPVVIKEEPEVQKVEPNRIDAVVEESQPEEAKVPEEPVEIHAETQNDTPILDASQENVEEVPKQEDKADIIEKVEVNKVEDEKSEEPKSEDLNLEVPSKQTDSTNTSSGLFSASDIIEDEEPSENSTN